MDPKNRGKPPSSVAKVTLFHRFVVRCEVGTQHWAQCNDVPVKFARFPVTGLVEGRSYVFRVRAVNKVGVSRPSRVSEAVVAMDPLDRACLRGQEDATVQLSTPKPHQQPIFLFYSFPQLVHQLLGPGLSNSLRRILLV